MQRNVLETSSALHSSTQIFISKSGKESYSLFSSTPLAYGYNTCQDKPLDPDAQFNEDKHIIALGGLDFSMNLEMHFQIEHLLIIQEYH